MLRLGGPFLNNLIKTTKRNNSNTKTVGILMRLKEFVEEKN